MNKEYTYINGKVIVRDNLNNQKVEEYYDNLDNVLIEENLIETMKNKILNLEEDIEIYRRNNSKHYIPIILISVIILSFTVLPLISKALGINLFESMYTRFGNINRGLLDMLFMASYAVPIGGTLELVNYFQYKIDKKKESATESELDYLKSQVIIEKEKLKKLKRNKKRELEDKTFRTIEINNNEKLSTLERQLEFYRNIGYNLNIYKEYYEKGKLNEALKDKYSIEEIEIITDIVKNKKYTLKK